MGSVSGMGVSELVGRDVDFDVEVSVACDLIDSAWGDSGADAAECVFQSFDDVFKAAPSVVELMRRVRAGVE